MRIIFNNYDTRLTIGLTRGVPLYTTFPALRLVGHQKEYNYEILSMRLYSSQLKNQFIIFLRVFIFISHFIPEYYPSSTTTTIKPSSNTTVKVTVTTKRPNESGSCPQRWDAAREHPGHDAFPSPVCELSSNNEPSSQIALILKSPTDKMSMKSLHFQINARINVKAFTRTFSASKIKRKLENLCNDVIGQPIHTGSDMVTIMEFSPYRLPE